MEDSGRWWRRGPFAATREYAGGNEGRNGPNTHWTAVPLNTVPSRSRCPALRIPVAAASMAGNHGTLRLDPMSSVRAFPHAASLLAAGLLAAAGTLAAQTPASRSEPKDPMQEGLPLKPARTVSFTTRAGHWMSVDVSPDGQTLVFDLLGDLYTLPIGGGKATPLTRGMAFDAQPRFSPDGKRIAFVSDRDGGYNLYQMSLDKRDTVQMTRGKTNTYESPDWTPDGKYIVVTRNMKLHLYHADGGSGQQLIREPANLRTLGAAVSPDGRYIWYAQRTGQWLYNTPLGDYSLATYDRQTGQTAVRASRWGSAFRPAVSPDGRWLVYGTRHIDTTRLRIRDLRNGDDKWFVMRTQRDDQESRASLDTYPGMSFTPDSRFLITTWDGKLWKVPVEGGAPQEIPLEADVVQALGPYVEFNYPIADSATFIVKQVRDAVPSPDGTKLAFTAMDRLYLMDWPNGTPRRLTTLDVGEFHPAWSRDGRSLAFTTMSARDGGHLYRLSIAPDARPRRLTTASAFYQRPVWTPDGARLVAIRGPFRAYEDALAGGVGGGAEDLISIPAAGGEATVIAPAGGLDNPHFGRDSTRLYLYSSQRGLVSMRLDGTDVKTHLRVNRSVPTPPGGGGGGGPPGGPAASLITISPAGDGEALAQVSGDVYVVTVPVVGGTEPTITVGGTESSFPVTKLTDIGGQFPTWSLDGRRVHWSIGNAHVSYDLAAGRAWDDSVRQARRGVRPDTTGGVPRPPPPPFKPFEKRILISAQRDIPQHSLVLRGARIISMKGDEVIENGDIVIRNNRIAALGARGTVEIPSGARTIDVAGATIVPGFVDTHAHVRATFDVHREQVWSYSANLAYGVTTIRDPQTASTDVLSYEDMVVAGKVVGPRIYSTGPGVFGGNNAQGNNLTSLDQARTILKRYSQYYDTKTIKQYQIGNREQRQWVIMAANELGLMPTTEGGLDYKMNVTEATDGYSGHEHTIPTFPLQSDFIRFLAESKTVYTPTILVAYGGPWAENYWYESENLLGDEKLKRFTPWADLEGKILRRGRAGQAGWFHPSQYVMKPIGESIRDLIAAGGRAGVGSHGQLQGLGYHWELWSMAMGGLSNHDALRIATQMGADALGLGKEVGSIESGKLADLVILDRNPLESLRNTNSIRMIVKNGRVYDGETLKER